MNGDINMFHPHDFISYTLTHKLIKFSQLFGTSELTKQFVQL